MAINQNHTAEELDGTRCAVVEKNVTKERAEFLKKILSWNGYEVVVAPAAPAKKPVSSEENGAEAIVENPKFTVGVTDLRFNTINAIFGRLLKTPEGKVVSRAYWMQEGSSTNDPEPYFDIQKGQ